MMKRQWNLPHYQETHSFMVCFRAIPGKFTYLSSFQASLISKIRRTSQEFVLYIDSWSVRSLYLLYQNYFIQKLGEISRKLCFRIVLTYFSDLRSLAYMLNIWIFKHRTDFWGCPFWNFSKTRQSCILFFVKKRGRFSSGSKIFVIIFLPGIFGIFVFLQQKMHSGTYALSHAFLPKKTKRSSGLRIFYLGDSSVIGRWTKLFFLAFWYFRAYLDYLALPL